MLPFASPMLMQPAAAGGGGGGIGSVTHALVATGNVSSIDLAFPTGAAAGDLAVAFTSHGYAINDFGGSQGFTSLDLENGDFINGAVAYKVLTSTDISRGYVSIAYAGVYYGVAGCICITGATGVRDYGALRFPSSIGPASATVTTNTTASQVGDLALYLGLCRANITVTESSGTALDLLSSNEASGTTHKETVATAGHVSETFTYGTGGISQYSVVVVVHS